MKTLTDHSEHDRCEVCEERGRNDAVDYLKEQAKYYNTSIQAEFMAKEEESARQSDNK